MLPRRFIVLPLMMLLLVLAGTVGYYLLEPEYSLFDGLYMTVTTLTTVGYGEVHPLSTTGRSFTIALILGGVFTLFYMAGEMVRGVVSGEVGNLLGRQRMERGLLRLKNHLIVCGYGRMGRLVCHEFASQKLEFVVIEANAELLANFSVEHGFPLHGDATSDEVLRRAGIERARALVTVLGSDADNLYITMSARLLNERLFIVARSEYEGAEPKLQRAGADRVVSPYAIGGARVAHAVLRPTVVDFLELAMRAEYLELQIEETLIGERSTLAGQTLRDSQLRQNLGLMIVAIKKANGQLIHNPPHDAVMQPGDILITLGHRQQLDQLDALADGGPRA